MGLALIGKPQGEMDLLKLAHAYELANQDMIARRPPGV
jgi:amidase